MARSRMRGNGREQPDEASTQLLGREAECDRINELLDAARRGESRVTVVRGEPGIGKTALLRYARDRAEDMVVLRATGIESEAELEFSALADLCRPLLGHLEEFPQWQADTLRTVLGVQDGRVDDRLAVGSATLGLLTKAAEEQPTLLILDDLQWMDQASLNAILFACRRFSADRVAVLSAVREGFEFADALRGFVQIRLTGLVSRDVGALLEKVAGRPATEQVVERLSKATQGNPLALMEMARVLHDDHLTGMTPIEEPLAVGTAVEHAFARRLRQLPEKDGKALLVVAVSRTEAVELIVSALHGAGLDVSTLERSEDEGLIHIADDRILFDHPLIRSVVHQMARPSERRAAHRAVAAALADADPEQSAWHLAAATIAPDEEVAAALEAAARVAHERSGYVGAAIALERAASLTPDPSVRGRRRYLAAQAACEAGRTSRALELLDGALTLACTQSLRAEMLYLRGRIQNATGPVRDAYESLVSAAALIEHSNPARAAEFLTEAAETMAYACQPERMLTAARRARELATAGTEAMSLAEMRMGEALLYLGRWPAASECFARAMSMMPDDQGQPWSPGVLANAALGLSWLDRRQPTARELVGRAVAESRAQGAITALVYILHLEAWVRLRSGHWRSCYAVATEAVELARETGQSSRMALALTVLCSIDAARGDTGNCRARVAEVVALAQREQFGYIYRWVRHCEALLNLGQGQVTEAIEVLESIERESLDTPIFGEEICVEPDLVEAYSKAGRRDDAQALLEHFSTAAGREYGLFGEAVVARCQGFLAAEDGYREHFENALTLHDKLGDPFATARTLLLFGERLRRSGDRSEARTRLRSALEAFDRLGAVPWSERARSELRASGLTVRRQDSAVVELTPQELQVAREVVTGKTNREVAAALFLSPKTVEFHLGSVFRKFGIRSRMQLARLITEETRAT